MLTFRNTLTKNTLTALPEGIELLSDEALDYVTGGACSCGCDNGCKGRQDRGCDQRGGGKRDSECNRREFEHQTGVACPPGSNVTVKDTYNVTGNIGANARIAKGGVSGSYTREVTRQTRCGR